MDLVSLIEELRRQKENSFDIIAKNDDIEISPITEAFQGKVTCVSVKKTVLPRLYEAIDQTMW